MHDNMHYKDNDDDFLNHLKKRVGEIGVSYIKESNKLMDVIDDIYYDCKDDCIYITIKDLVKALPKNSYDKLMDNLFNELKVYDSNFTTKTNYKII
jgi:hypothetical protein